MPRYFLTNLETTGDTVSYSAELGPAECLPAGITEPDWRLVVAAAACR